MVLPMTSPIGVMPISTPTRKKVSPTTIIAAPTRNLINNVAPSGVNVKFKISTMIMIGKTEDKTSFSLSVSAFK